MIKFAYPEDYGIKLPVLVLATKQINLSFKPGKLWIPLRHQTAGVACNQHEFIVNIIPVSENMQENMKIISNHFYEKNLGVLWTQLDEVNEYRKLLNSLFNVDCNNSFHDLEEGLYPIDIEYLSKFSVFYPDNLGELTDFKKPMEEFCGFASRWKLFIIGPNSD